MNKFCFQALLGKKCHWKKCDFIHTIPEDLGDVLKIKSEGSCFKHIGDAEAIVLYGKWGFQDLESLNSQSEWTVFPRLADVEGLETLLFKTKAKTSN